MGSFWVSKHIQVLGYLHTCQGGRTSPQPYLSWVLAAGLIMKLTQDRLTGGKESLNGEQEGLIEMVPTKWPKQTAFILFRQRNSKFERS